MKRDKKSLKKDAFPQKSERTILSTQELLSHIRFVVEKEGMFFLTVTGYSMSPTLKHERDQVILVSRTCRPEKKGEIVLFCRPFGDCILHRIKKELPDGRLMMNGDIQSWCEVIRREQIVAVVSEMVRKERRISCDNRVYRAYVWLWMRLFPCRRGLIRVWGWLHGGRRRAS